MQILRTDVVRARHARWRVADIRLYESCQLFTLTGIDPANARAERRMLAEETLVGGRAVVVRHTPFEAGSLADLFDGDSDTRVLTAGANPLVIELDFGEAVRITGLTLTADLRNLGLTFQGFAEGLQPARYEAEFRDRGVDPFLDVTFDPPPGLVSRVVIEIEDLDAPPGTSVALGELALRER